MAERPLLPRVARPGLLIGFILVVLVLIAAAFVVGMLLGGQQASTLTQEHDHITVTAQVTTRQVVDNRVGDGTVAVGTTVSVPVNGRKAPEVVTAVGVSAGKTVKLPTYVAAVNDRPIFLIHLKIPMYRDLIAGDRGADVSALRTAFGLAPDGPVDWALQQRVSAMYQDAGWKMPRRSGTGYVIRRSEITSTTVSHVLFSAVKPVGSVLHGGDAVATVKTRPNVVTARVTENRTDRISKGASVALNIQGETVPGTVTKIGAFTPASGDATAGYDVTIAFDDAAAAEGYEKGVPVQINTTKTAKATLAVPLTAIGQDGDDTYVLVPGRDDDQPHRAAVTVTAEADGFAAITSDELSEGDRVVVG